MHNKTFNKIFGTGGLGKGSIYKMDTNSQLSRSESRCAFKLPYKDFCKIHIILHYVTVLIHDLNLNVKVYPIAAVGDDQDGQELVELISKTGMNTKYINILEKHPTLSSIVHLYPNGDCSNITEGNSACNNIPNSTFESAIDLIDQNSIVVAAPEIPIQQRLTFLKNSKIKKAYTIASFNQSECQSLRLIDNIWGDIDLLILNKEEAMALLKLDSNTKINDYRGCLDKWNDKNGLIPKIIITNGGDNLLYCDHDHFEIIQPIKAEVKSTAGAGDAFFSGILYGLIKNLPLYAINKESCIQYGTHLAKISVESWDSINENFNLEMLKKELGLINGF